jgi:hypothetical protein
MHKLPSFLPIIVLVALFAGQAAAQDGGPDLDPEDGGAFMDGGVPAQSDGGALILDGGGLLVADASLGACTEACEGNVLTFCDPLTDESHSLDCNDLEARCGLLNEAWGLDCLLPLGAECHPGYAEGATRCDRESAGGSEVHCTEGMCSTQSPEHDAGPTPPGLVDGTGRDSTTEDGCLGCGSSGGLPFLGALFWLGFRRRGRGVPPWAV